MTELFMGDAIDYVPDGAGNLVPVLNAAQREAIFDGLVERGVYHPINAAAAEATFARIDARRRLRKSGSDVEFADSGSQGTVRPDVIRAAVANTHAALAGSAAVFGRRAGA